jgi:predicted nucleotidyltransferase
MYMIIQKCSLWKVAEVFFIEPTKIHFIKEISRKVNLAPTSIKLHLQTLIKEGLVEEAKSEPFNGYRAIRENPAFIFEKKMANIILIKSSGLIDELKEKYPKSIIVFGSYDKGEDIETSDIDLFIDSKIFKFNQEKFEKYLKRKIHVIFKEEASKSLYESINQGTILFGEK